MTSPIDEVVAEWRESVDDTALFDAYISGETDASFGSLPKRRDSAYLQGYCAGIRQLPVHPDGTIKWYTPPQKNDAEFVF